MRKPVVLKRGLALDIDETLSATNKFWAEYLNGSFGNPDNLTADQIVAVHRYAQQVPYWQSPNALAWMEKARMSDELQEILPIIENAHHVVEKVHMIVPIAAYITARPISVERGTKKWLTSHGFPEAPLIMRPSHVPAPEGNKWKADTLVALYPEVVGIIDDNAGLIEHLPSGYKGIIFLYDHHEAPKSTVEVVPVKTWDDVLPKIHTYFKNYEEDIETDS